MEMLLFIKYNFRAVGWAVNLPEPPPEWSPPNQSKVSLQEGAREDVDRDLIDDSEDDGLESESGSEVET